MKLTSLLKQSLCLFSILLFGYTAGAQDIHYTQAFSSPLNLSPALAGLYGGEHRLTANGRNQWRSVPVDYVSVSASYDTKINYYPGKSGFFGAGIQVNHDIAGDSRLALLQVNGNLSYTQRLAKRHLITLGGQIGGGQRYFKTNDLTFNDQYIAGKPTLRGTNQPFQNLNKQFMTVAAGGNWRYQVEESRTFINAGGAIYHINRPDVGFYESSKILLPRRWSAYVLGTYMLTNNIDLIANYTQQWQGPHREPLMGIRGKFYLIDPQIRTFAIQVGGHYRFKDAIAPVVKLNLDHWEFGFSYDVNLSNFDPATNFSGGPEMSLIYTFQKIRPDICILCPEYL